MDLSACRADHDEAVVGKDRTVLVVADPLDQATEIKASAASGDDVGADLLDIDDVSCASRWDSKEGDRGDEGQSAKISETHFLPKGLFARGRLKVTGRDRERKKIVRVKLGIWREPRRLYE